MRFEETLGLSHLLRLTDHAMKRRMDQALSQYRLTSAQYMALSAIEARGAATQADISRECSVTPQTTNRLVDGLVERGLICRSTDPSHGRKVTLTLTKKARTTVCEAHVAVNDVECCAVDHLNASQIQMLLETLRRLADRMGEPG